MNVRQRRKAAKEFSKRWKGRGSERQDSQKFWLDLLSSVYGIENPGEYITFEDSVVNMMDRTSFIDGYIEKTNVLIEQKGIDRDLNKGIRQSDGSLLTPFQQAMRYSATLPYSKRPRWILTSNFKEFYIYDMEKPSGEPAIVELKNLENEYYRLEILIDKTNTQIERETKVSIQAGELVGQIYDELLEQYNDPEDPHSLESINQLCVRLVFCFYAEDAGLFGKKGMFHDYLADFNTRHFRNAIIDLFHVLNTKEEDRDPYLDEKLALFPYVNGNLFEYMDIEVPQFTDHLRELILHNATSDFDWSEISPTIFGGVFESTLNPEQRRKGGMHYTSIENIHKVIDPLFLDELKEELNEIKQLKQPAAIRRRARAFQEKLGSLTFFDPAAGSGNFLTETYLSLRELENQALLLVFEDHARLDTDEDLIKVKLDQFYGLEINDFAVSVAKTALWIAESQMFEKTKDLIFSEGDFLPLKSYPNIKEGNALVINWNSIIDKRDLNYIIGNPPFIGYSDQSQVQKNDLKTVYTDDKGKSYRGSGKIDYVAGWFMQASRFMVDSNIKTAFVSTNSITQGDQVSFIWKPLFEDFEIEIDFAYHSIQWRNESSNVAQVQVVIIGFGHKNNTRKEKIIYDGELKYPAKNINPYLLDRSNIFIDSRTNPICNVLEMISGNRAADGGHLIINESELNDFVKREPNSKKYIKELVGGNEMLHNEKRYCLWLVNVEPSEIRKMPLVMNRIEETKKSRLNGALDRQKLADTPSLFRETRNPEKYILIPSVSSEKRRYIPIGFFGKNHIPLAPALIIPDADMYYFGILNSNVHMAWVRAVAGRREGRYRYSKKIVYNDFPWPEVSDEGKMKIEKTAQRILDARKLYPNSTLADLYDELTMPVELRKAHQDNDRAVMEAYGMDVRTTSESDALTKLFELYDALIAK
ncbi:methylase [Bacillus wiedmannii]|uniref:DNA methyltransferase n=1 Tax=Bacillus wiedmannii TaxID=1890302 RepID=UPI000BFE11C1|nr:DNA methyltransferase [Bacillus wiedmannii]PHA24285.1 methylase [Bacillus wiedmannii]PHB14816.1 methylase [Bacillus wiedmannii]